MFRASHLPPLASPALFALRLPLLQILNLPSSFSSISSTTLCRLPTVAFSHSHKILYQSLISNSTNGRSRLSGMVDRRHCPEGTASFSAGSSYEDGRAILVQHLLVKEDDHKLLLELQKKLAEGEDLSNLAVEYSICPSKEEGGMLGWVRKGQMVPEFEEAAFNASVNQVVRCKTKFGWHLLQVLSEREESILKEIQPDELHLKMQDSSFFEDAQLIDVREPEEVERASLLGFQVLPLCQFGSWGPEVATKFDPQKDTYVLGFTRVFNVSGGIHAYAVKADPSIPTY